MQIRPATQEEVEQLQKAGPLPLVPLGMDMQVAITNEEMARHFNATLERGYVSINSLLGSHHGKCSVVGAGPSLKETYKELEGDVLAVNSALNFLLDNEVVPKYAMFWDGLEVVETFARPHPGVIYLIASRCHPKVFERLKGCDVRVWHAGGDMDILKRVEDAGLKEPLINGGSAGITRGLFVAWALGYSEIHFHGGDSSYSDDGKTHVRSSVVPEKDVFISIGNNPPIWFRTTPEWCAQVEEYRTFYSLMTVAGQMKFKVHGTGMLRTMHDLLEAKLALVGKDKFLEDMLANENKRLELAKKAADLPEGSPHLVRMDYVKPSLPLEELR